MKNLLTDIAGVRVGHADDARLASGVTAILFDKPAVAAIDVRGGGPGTREEAALRPESTVEGQAVGGYVVKRYDADSGALQVTGVGCQGTIAALECTETTPPGKTQPIPTMAISTGRPCGGSAMTSR